MKYQKISSYIGFAVRAGDVVFGLDNILTSRKRISVIVTDSSLGEASLRKLNNYLANRETEVVTLDNMLLGRDILKRYKCKIIGVLNKSLGDAIISASKAE